MHLSEDDIRTKVVHEWLKSCGLSVNNIFIEKTLSLQLGRKEKKINLRTDVLVKNEKNQNLIIVEVKKPDKELNDEDEKQALSYARCLSDGIAPFTILTNGKQALIYDSVTGVLISSDTIPNDHPHIESEFIPTGDAISARMEALEYLISLSEENLLTFCEGQVKHRMKPLRGDELDSGKKYLPQLFVDRGNEFLDLKAKLFGNDKKRIERKEILLVVGQPQQGKTCFICNTVEQLLEEKNPVLFFPAIGLTNGLISSLKEDLEWSFFYQDGEMIWIRKLDKIAHKAGKRLILFIDGWNEMAKEAFMINEECKRLGLNNISVVLSTTSPSLDRLLRDNSNNPSYIYEKVGLSSTQLRKLMSEPLRDTRDLGVVQIGGFNAQETELAKKIYSKEYNVELPDNEVLLSDPFYVRIACEQFAGGQVDNNLSKKDLIRNSLFLKGRRRGIKEVDLLHGLKDLAERFYSQGRPISVMDLPQRFQNEDRLNQWRDSAILTKVYFEEEPFIDFYYTHDLDYSVAELHCKWSNRFNRKEEVSILEELCKSSATEVGKSALRWYFSSSENCEVLKYVLDTLQIDSCFNTVFGKILTESIMKQVTINNRLDFAWLEDYLDKLIALETNSSLQLSEVPELLYSTLLSFDWEEKPDSYKFWMSLLIKYDNSIDDLGFHECYIHKVYGERIESFDGYLDTALDVELFEGFLLDSDLEVAKRSGYFLAHASPYYYIETLIPRLAKNYVDKLDQFHEILEYTCPQIIQQINENYYGGMCPGWLSYRGKGDDEVKEEYWQQKKMWFPILKLLKPNSDLYAIVTVHLDDLKEYAQITSEEDEQHPFIDPNQLSLGF